MADFADEGQALEELALQQALENHRKNTAERKLLPRGLCYNCDEPLEVVNGLNAKLFCNSDCSEDWEHRTKKR